MRFVLEMLKQKGAMFIIQLIFSFTEHLWVCTISCGKYCWNDGGYPEEKCKCDTCQLYIQYNPSI